MKPGYKQTELGVIPEDWAIRSLDRICDVRDGTHESPAFFRDGIPFVTSKNIVDGRLDLENVSYISKIDAVQFDKRSKVDRNDILLSMIGTIGSAVLVDCEPRFCIKNVALLKPRTVAPTFLIQLINSPVFQKYLADNLDGGIQKFISLGKLRQLSIPLPDVPEQRAIAEALSDVDGLLGALDRLIAKKRNLKQAAMQQLLTSQTRLPGFHGEWEVTVLGTLLTMKATYGIVTAGDFKGTGVPMMRGGDIKGGRVGYDLPFVSPEKSSEYSRTILKRDDVVIALVGYPGEAAKVPVRLEGANISRAVGLLRLNKLIEPDYLVSYLNSPMGRRMVLAPSAGSAQLVVNLAELNKLEFPLPPLPEQTAIAEVLSEMDAELAGLEQRREKTRALKQGMMQELLTGRTRLPTTELDETSSEPACTP